MRYSRKTSKHLERIKLFDPTHIICMADSIAVSVETLRIDSGYSLEKEFTELICMIYVAVVYVIL